MKENKLFVKTMIITASVTFAILLLGVFIGIKSFTKGKPNVEKVSEDMSTSIKEATSLDTKFLGAVEELKDTTITVLDPQKKQFATGVIEKVTQVQDAYGRPMPLEGIEKGDVVELTYTTGKERVISIVKPKGSWEKTNIKAVDIDILNKRIYIGENVYTFFDNTMVLNKEGEKITIEQVGKQDTLEMIGVEDKVYTIKILEKQGTIEIEQLPSYEGIVEIDRNRQINLRNLNGPIPIVAGKHKVVIKMDGYKDIVQEVEVKEGENTLVKAESPQEAYTEVRIEVMNSVTAYTVEVDGISYNQYEKIIVTRGKHRIKVNAEGFKSWAGDMTFEEPIVRVQVTLEPLVTTQPQEETKAPNATNTNSTVNANTPVSTDNTETTPDDTINLSTDPEGAKIYINGVYKGVTPYNTKLSIGAYSILFQKQGYEDYTTSLIIDNSDNQNSHLYILTPTE